MVIESQIEKIMEILKKEFHGVRKTTLNREAKVFSPYQTLISCLLSLQAKDETTERISYELFKIAKTPKQIIALAQKKLEKIIFSSGYYKNKAKAIKTASRQIIEDYGGKVPDTEEELLKLYGVGRKTANIVLSLAFGKSVLPIDTHCHRIPNRLGWIKTKTPEQTEIAIGKILPKKYWPQFNGLFVLFGKKTCVPISPFCSICPVRKYCRRIGVKNFR